MNEYETILKIVNDPPPTVPWSRWLVKHAPSDVTDNVKIAWILKTLTSASGVTKTLFTKLTVKELGQELIDEAEKTTLEELLEASRPRRQIDVELDIQPLETTDFQITMTTFVKAFESDLSLVEIFNHTKLKNEWILAGFDNHWKTVGVNPFGDEPFPETSTEEILFVSIDKSIERVSLCFNKTLEVTTLYDSEDKAMGEICDLLGQWVTFDSDIPTTRLINGRFDMPDFAKHVRDKTKILLTDLVMNSPKVYPLFEIDEFFRSSTKKKTVNLWHLETEIKTTLALTGQVTLFKVKDDKMVLKLMDQISSVLAFFVKYQNDLGEIYQSHLGGKGWVDRSEHTVEDISEDSSADTIGQMRLSFRELSLQQQLKKLEPDIFVLGFSRKCLKQPRALVTGEPRPEDPNKWVVFPKPEEPHKRIRTYVCDHHQDAKWPGIRKIGPNNYAPCCFVVPQKEKPGTDFRRYMFGETKEKHLAKDIRLEAVQQARVTTQVPPNLKTIFGSKSKITGKASESILEILGINPSIVTFDDLHVVRQHMWWRTAENIHQKFLSKPDSVEWVSLFEQMLGKRIWLFETVSRVNGNLITPQCFKKNLLVPRMTDGIVLVQIDGLWSIVTPLEGVSKMFDIEKFIFSGLRQTEWDIPEAKTQTISDQGKTWKINGFVLQEEIAPLSGVPEAFEPNSQPETSRLALFRKTKQVVKALIMESEKNFITWFNKSGNSNPRDWIESTDHGKSLRESLKEKIIFHIELMKVRNPSVLNNLTRRLIKNVHDVDDCLTTDNAQKLLMSKPHFTGQPSTTKRTAFYLGNRLVESLEVESDVDDSKVKTFWFFENPSSQIKIEGPDPKGVELVIFKNGTKLFRQRIQTISCQ